MKDFCSQSMSTMPSCGDILCKNARKGRLNASAKEFVPGTSWGSLSSAASPTFHQRDAVPSRRCRGYTIRKHGPRSSTNAEIATTAPVMVQPTTVAPVEELTEVEAVLHALIAAVSVSEELMATEMPVLLTTEPAAVGEEMVPKQVEAAGDAPTKGVSASAVSEAVANDAVAETLVVTTAEPSTVEPLLAEGRGHECEIVQEVAAGAGASVEASSSCRGRRWKGVHVGVWVAIGAGVAVGAALWGRRR